MGHCDCFGGKSPNALVHWVDGGELEQISTYTMLGVFTFKTYRCSICGAICDGQSGEQYGPRIGYEIQVLEKHYTIAERDYADELLFKGI